MGNYFTTVFIVIISSYLAGRKNGACISITRISIPSASKVLWLKPKALVGSVRPI